MTSQPTSGPGSGVIASKYTAITSAQIKALFTTAVAVSPTPRSNEIIVPLFWTATADDSDTNYVNGPGGALALTYAGVGGSLDMSGLLTALTGGAPSFAEARTGGITVIGVSDVAGVALTMGMDTGNLTAGDFPIAFTLFYAVIPS